MTHLLLELKPSRYFAAGLIVAHLAAGGSAAATLDGWALLLSVLGVALSCIACVGESLLLWPTCPINIQLNEDSSGRWTDRRGNVRTASSVAVSHIATWLVILGLHQSRHRTRWIVVPVDAVGGAEHRKLRLWARWHMA